MDPDEQKWRKRLERERRAREQAEQLLEEKSRELFEKNEALEGARNHLEELVEKRTREVRRLSLVAEYATCGVVITDAGGKTEWVNTAFRQMTGYTLAEVQGKAPGHLLQGSASDAETIRRMGRAISRKESFSEEILNYRKDGSPYWIRLDATPIRDGVGEVSQYIAIQTDVTERRQAEKRMGVLTRALEQSSDGFALTDSNGFFTYLNPAHVAIFGYANEEEMKGRSWRMLYDEEESERLQREVFPVLARKGTWKGRAMALRKDGSRFPEDLTLTLLGDGRIICTCRDDTVRVEGEEALRQSKAKAEALNEELRKTILELDAFAHTVAHDLKNPLQGILGLSESLRCYWDDIAEEEKKELVSMIEESGVTMGNIVNELLLLASVRKEKVELAPVEPLDLIEKARKRLLYRIRETKARIEVTEPLGSFLGYGPWVEEVLSNFCSNALKYGGTPPWIRIGTDRTPDGRVLLWVEDNGPGIPQDQRKGLFEEFTRYERVRAEGHGLGLSIVRRIMDKLGGEVGADDAVTGLGGARFFAIFPALEEQ